MKKTLVKIAVLVSFLMLICCSTNVFAQEEKPEASADIGVFSKYVWRGYEFSDESAVIQPSITVTYKSFSFNLWGNLDTDEDLDTRHESNFNETDMTLSYAKSFGLIGLDVGYIYYALDGIDDSKEIYLSMGLDTLLAPTLTVYREIAHMPSWYFSFGISHSIDITDGITLDMAGSVGYYYSDDDDFTEFDSNLNPTNEKYENFHDGLISVGLTIPLDKYFTLSPMIAYSFPLTDDSDDHISGSSAFGNDSDFVFCGVTLSMAF